MPYSRAVLGREVGRFDILRIVNYVVATYYLLNIFCPSAYGSDFGA